MSLTTQVSVKENRVSTKTKDCFQLQTGIILGMLHVGLWLATITRATLSTNQTRNLKQLTIKKHNRKEMQQRTAEEIHLRNAPITAAE